MKENTATMGPGSPSWDSVGLQSFQPERLICLWETQMCPVPQQNPLTGLSSSGHDYHD